MSVFMGNPVLVSLIYVMGEDQSTQLLQKSTVFSASLSAGACELTCDFTSSMTAVLGAHVLGTISEGLQYRFVN